MQSHITVILSGRPRLVHDQALVLGADTSLAKRVMGPGYWRVERLDDDAMAALLSAVYAKTIRPSDPIFRAVVEAADLMLLDRHRAQSLLARLPEPPPDSARRLTKADTLLKAGVRPADLPVMLRRAEWGLSPAPAYAASLTLSDQGVVLGKGTVIVPLDDDPGLAVAGNEERILTLLSVARWGLAAPDMLEKLAGAHRFLARGEVGLAAIHLALSGQPPLAHRGEAEALDLAARELDKGMRPFDLLKGLGLLPGDAGYGAWRKYAKFAPDQPRDYHGRWTDGSNSGDGGDSDDTADSSPGLSPAAQAVQDGMLNSGPSDNTIQVADNRPLNARTDATPASVPTDSAPTDPGAWMWMQNPTWNADHTQSRISDTDFEAMRATLFCSNLTDVEKYCILNLYAWEGGLKNNDGTIAGLTSETRERLDLADPETPEDVVSDYIAVINDNLKFVGGIKALDQIEYPVAAMAFIDTIFYQGIGGGGSIVRGAVNDVQRDEGMLEVNSQGVVRRDVFDAYCQSVYDEETRKSLLAALRAQRIKWLARKPAFTPSQIESDTRRFTWMS